VDLLYRTGWEGQGCVAIAAQVSLIGIAAIAATFAVMGVILRIATRRQPVPFRTLRWPAAGLGALILGIILFAALDGRTTHRILVSDTGLVFEGCDGIAPFAETIPFAEVTEVAHRTRRAGSRSSRLVDEAVLTLRGAKETRIIPLSRDPSTLDPALLRRVLPAAVIEAWGDSLARRGVRVPRAP
jgi:hypothetical protein